MKAYEVCESSERDFNEIFRRQYFLTETGGMCPEGWRMKRLGGWHLYHCPDLPVAEIRAAKGEKAGYFLGIGVGLDGQMFPGTSKLPVKITARNFWDRAEREIEGIGGRYVVLLSDGKCARVYVDPVCDLATVFDPTTRVVASSVLLCLHRSMRRNLRVDYRGPMKLKHNFALQHTADRFVKRAMANHYLDLSTFSPVRHFPRGDEVFETSADDIEDSCGRIVERLSAIMAALLQNHACVIPVTGGNDSRNLLACCGDNIGRAKSLFTFHMNKMSGFDCMIAQQIGKELGVEVDTIDVLADEHRHLFEKETMQRKRRDIVHATGFQWPGSSEETVAASQLAPGADILIRGNVMELMRANQYEPGNWYKFSLQHALSQLRVAPEIDETQKAIWGPEYMMWVDTLPRNARRRIYDFAFCEQLLPNTMGGVLIAPTPQFYMNVFSDRTMISLAMSMDPKVRRGNRMNKMLVDLGCPGLSRIPRTNKFRKNPGNHLLYDELFGKAA